MTRLTHDFDTVTMPRREREYVPPCAAEIYVLLADGVVSEDKAQELLSKCRNCANRYKEHGWMNIDHPDGIWRGCAQIDLLREEMMR